MCLRKQDRVLLLLEPPKKSVQLRRKSSPLRVQDSEDGEDELLQEGDASALEVKRTV